MALISLLCEGVPQVPIEVAGVVLELMESGKAMHLAFGDQLRDHRAGPWRSIGRRSGNEYLLGTSDRKNEELCTVEEPRGAPGVIALHRSGTKLRKIKGEV